MNEVESSGASSSTPTIDVVRLIDDVRWTAYQQRLLALVAITIVLDDVDNQLLGIAMPSVMAEWGLPRSAFAPRKCYEARDRTFAALGLATFIGGAS
ncbi:MAG: hypothetical protein ABI024_06870 [Vicinamibacterales bacterium]